MKITVTEEHVFPTLGIIAQAGDTVELPDDVVVVSSKKLNAKDVIADGTATV